MVCSGHKLAFKIRPVEYFCIVKATECSDASAGGTCV